MTHDSELNILCPFKDLFPFYYIMSYKEALKELKEMNLIDPRRAIQFQSMDVERLYMYKILVNQGSLEIFTDKIKDIKEDIKIKDILERKQKVHDKERDIFISLTH